MTKFARRLLVVLACAALPRTGAGGPPPLVFLGDRDLAPFEFVVNGVPRGINVDLAHAVGRVLGREVEVQLLDWSEAQRRVQEGSGDVLTFMAPTPEREALYDFTRPTVPVAFSLFVREADRSTYAGKPLADALQGRRVGVTRAGFPRAFLEGAHPNAQFVPVDNLLDGTRRLSTGEIDALGAPRWGQEFLLAELGLDNFVALPPFAERPGAMAVRKGNAALRDQLDRALEEIERSGELQSIMQQWSTTRLRVISQEAMLALATATGVGLTALLLLSAGLLWSRRQKQALEREVHVRVAAERALLATQQALRDADQRKDLFIAMLGHELRNPLAPISMAVHLLGRKGSDSQQGRWALDTIRRQMKLMVRLIDDLLDVGRITSGKLALQRQPVRLSEAISDAVEASRPTMEDKQHAFSHLEAAPDVWVDADRARLTQVVSNLLTNAAKYTPAGGRIDLSVEVDGDDVEIRVEDNGVGIAPAQLPGLFEMFHQLDRAREGSDAGLGIGLWLSRHLVELHGGTIEASSAGPGQGTRFTVALPKLRCPAPDGVDALAPVIAAAPDERPVALRAVVADDNVDSAEAVSRLLASLGCSVETATDGAQALETIRRTRPHFVLLDIAMPELDGLEVCRQTRLEPWGREVRIIAMSGWGDAQLRAASAAVGFDEHLVKPVDAQALEDRLRAVRAAPDAPDGL